MKRTKQQRTPNNVLQNSGSQYMIDKRIVYALAFCLPALSMIIIYAIFKVFPFGDRTNLVMDLNGQYADFFAYYHRVLTGNDSLLYSFSKEMGGNVFGLFAYYLSSPFFLLALFFPVSAMPEGIAIVTILKIGSCGLTFAVFLKNVFRKSDLSVLLFSCAYALMTYSMHYSMCIMWLDGVIWLPIILLGTERILDNKSGWIFLFSYAMSLISNYYTAYMNTLFVILYFFCRYFSKDIKKSPKDLLFKILKILGLGIVCVMLALCILLPTFIDIFNGKMASGSFVADGFWNTDITKISRRLFIGQYDSITNRGNPNIFCGMLCGIMTGVYFFNPRIKLKEKIASLVVFAVLITSFFIKRVDMMWHIFQYPNWYPYRYAYIFCFFAVMTAFHGFSETEKKVHVGVICGIAAYVILLLSMWLFRRDALTNTTLAAVSFIFVGIYIAGLLLYLYGKDALRPYICAGIILLTCSELVLNGYTTITGLNKEHTFKSRSEYAEKVSTISGLIDFIKEQDKSLYRTEKTFTRTDNDSMTFGYNGMTHYSSTYNNNIVHFNNRMGMLQESVLIRYMGSTLITDSLLGVKYIISENKVNDEYREIHKQDKYSIYKNPYALPFAFAAENSSLESPSYGSSALENQNLFAESVLGEAFLNAVPSLDKINSDSAIEFTVKGNGTYYLDLASKYDQGVELTVNGTRTAYPYDTNLKKIYCLGKYKTGDRIRVKLSNPDIISKASVYFADTESFQLACRDRAENHSLNINKYGNGWIDGEITLNENQLIFTTIPYEKGWKAYIDGKKAETLCAQNTFLAIPASPGTHTVYLKYSVPWLKTSAAVSLLTLIGVLYTGFKTISKNNTRKKESENE